MELHVFSVIGKIFFYSDNSFHNIMKQAISSLNPAFPINLHIIRYTKSTDAAPTTHISGERKKKKRADNTRNRYPMQLFLYSAFFANNFFFAAMRGDYIIYMH